MCLARGKSGFQFPLILAYVSTIHKVQVLTLDKTVVDMESTCLSPGQVYGAFSQVKKLDSLYIVNFNKNAIKAKKDVKKKWRTFRVLFQFISAVITILLLHYLMYCH